MSSLDALVEFIVDKLAYQASTGANKDDLAKFAHEFYSRGFHARDVHAGDKQHDVAIDDFLLGKLTQWLGAHDAVETFNASPVEPDGNGHGHEPTELRMRTTTQRIWRAITGHGPDESKVRPLEFALLSLIAREGEKGISQPELVRQSGQDKRSLPHRTDLLRDRGYIEKKPVSLAGAKTSWCTLTKFVEQAPEIDIDGAIDRSEDLLPLFIFEDSGTFLPDRFLAVALRVIRKHGLLEVNRFCQIMGVSERPPRRKWSKATKKMLARMALMGCIEQVSIASGTKKRLTVCLKFVQEPDEVARRSICSLTDTLPASLVGRTSNGSKIAEIQSDRTERAGNADQASLVSQSNGLATRRASLPSWDPERPILYQLYDALKLAGTRGMSGTELSDTVFSPFWRRSLDHVLLQLTDSWQTSQPPALRHLSVVRDSAQQGRALHYQYYTYEAFAALVQANTTSWEAIGGDFEDSQQTLDEWGFPNIPADDFTNGDGSATISESFKQISVAELSEMPEESSGPVERSPKTVSILQHTSFIKNPEQRKLLGLKPLGRPRKDASRPEAGVSGTTSSPRTPAKSQGKMPSEDRIASHNPFGPRPTESDYKLGWIGDSGAMAFLTDAWTTAQTLVEEENQVTKGVSPIISGENSDPEADAGAGAQGIAEILSDRPRYVDLEDPATVEPKKSELGLDNQAKITSAPTKDYSNEPLKLRDRARTIYDSIVSLSRAGVYRDHPARKGLKPQEPGRQQLLLVIKSHRLRELSLFGSLVRTTHGTSPKPRAASNITDHRESPHIVSIMRSPNNDQIQATQDERPAQHPPLSASEKDIMVASSPRRENIIIDDDAGHNPNAQLDNFLDLSIPEKAHEIDDQDPLTTEKDADVDLNSNADVHKDEDTMPQPQLVEESVEREMIDASRVKGLPSKARRRGAQLGQGSIAWRRGKMLLEAVEKAGGMYPGPRELQHLFLKQASSQNISDEPDAATVLRVAKNLVASGKLKKFGFVFDGRGVPRQHAVYALPEYSVHSPLVKDMQEKIISMWPKSYIPAGVEISRIPRYPTDQKLLRAGLIAVPRKIRDMSSKTISISKALEDIPTTSLGFARWAQDLNNQVEQPHGVLKKRKRSLHHDEEASRKSKKSRSDVSVSRSQQPQPQTSPKKRVRFETVGAEGAPGAEAVARPHEGSIIDLEQPLLPSSSHSKLIDPIWRVNKRSGRVSRWTLCNSVQPLLEFLRQTQLLDLLASVLTVRTILGGKSQQIDWPLVAKLLDKKHDRYVLVSQWRHMERQYHTEFSLIQFSFQKRFLEDYKSRRLPQIIFRRKHLVKWGALKDWAVGQISSLLDPVTEYTPDQPLQTRDLHESFVVQPLDVEDQTNDVMFRPQASVTRRIEYIKDAAFFSKVPETVVTAPPVSAELLTVAKSYVLAFINTPEESVDEAQAKKKFACLPSNAVDAAVVSLTREKRIRHLTGPHSKSGRHYCLTDGFMRSLQLFSRHGKSRGVYKNAIAFKYAIDEAFETNGFYHLSAIIDDHHGLVLGSLLSKDRIRLDVVLPEPTHDPNVNVAAMKFTPSQASPDRRLSVWGVDPGNYKTSGIDLKHLVYPLRICPTKSYVKGVGLPLQPSPAPAPHLSAIPKQQRIPIWYDINDHFLPGIWNQVGLSVLRLMHQRPRVSKDEIVRAMNGIIDTDDVALVQNWLLSIGIIRLKDMAVTEWWWAVFPDDENDERPDDGGPDDEDDTRVDENEGYDNELPTASSTVVPT